MNRHHRHTTLFSLFFFLFNAASIQATTDITQWNHHHPLYTGSNSTCEKSSVLFSLDGSLFSVTSPSLGIDVWGPSQFKKSIYNGHVFITKIPFIPISTITCMAITDEYYAIGTEDGTLFIYKFSLKATINPALEKVITISGLGYSPTKSFASSMTFSHDKNFLLIGDNHGAIIKWNYITDEHTGYKPLQKAIKILKPLPNNSGFIASDLNNVILMDTTKITNKYRHLFYSPDRKIAAISSSGQYIALTIDNKIIKVCDIKKRTCTTKSLHQGHVETKKILSNIAFLPDETHCICADSDGMIFFISTTPLNEQKTPNVFCLKNYRAGIESINCSPCGKIITINSYRRDISLLRIIQ